MNFDKEKTDEIKQLKHVIDQTMTEKGAASERELQAAKREIKEMKEVMN